MVSWERERGERYMPEFPPVTMKTLPVRSGRVEGWKGMFERRTWKCGEVGE